VILDLDGVSADTAAVHAIAWRRLFDEYLAIRPAAPGEDQSPFTDDDYRRFVDGRYAPGGPAGRTGQGSARSWEGSPPVRPVNLPEPGVVPLPPSVWGLVLPAGRLYESPNPRAGPREPGSDTISALARHQRIYISGCPAYTDAPPHVDSPYGHAAATAGSTARRYGKCSVREVLDRSARRYGMSSVPATACPCRIRAPEPSTAQPSPPRHQHQQTEDGPGEVGVRSDWQYADLRDGQTATPAQRQHGTAQQAKYCQSNVTGPHRSGRPRAGCTPAGQGTPRH
jgi:hypothetical protein